MADDIGKRAPLTTSMMSLDDQFIYRLAQLESTVSSGFSRLNEKFDGMSKDMNERREAIARDMGALEARVATIEKWQTVMTVRFSGIISLAFIVWTVFGDYIRQMMGTNL